MKRQKMGLVLKRETIKVLQSSDIRVAYGGARTVRTERCGDDVPTPTTSDHSYVKEGTCA